MPLNSTEWCGYDDYVDMIRRDRDQASLALIGGEDVLPFMEKAARLVYDHAGAKDRCLIKARRAAGRKYKLGSWWVIQTQMQFIRIAEQEHLDTEFLSEAQIKRGWKRLVDLTAEIAVRML